MTSIGVTSAVSLKWGRGSGMAGLAFNAPLTYSAFTINSLSGYTFTRNDSDATVTDWEGLIHQVGSEEIRFEGARRVENLFDPSAAAAVNIGTTNTSRNGDILEFEVAGTPLYYWQVAVGAGVDVVASYWVRRISGSGSIGFIGINSGLGTTVSAAVLDDGEWHRISEGVKTTSSASAHVGIYGVGAGVQAGDVFQFKAQLENVAGQSNQNPSEYVSVGVGTGENLNTDPTLVDSSQWDINAASVTVGDGKVQFNLPTNGDYAAIGNPTEGKLYTITVVVDSISGTVAQLQIYFGDTLLGAPDAAGIYTYQHRANDATDNYSAYPAGAMYLWWGAGVNPSCTVSKFAIVETDHGANVDGVQYFPYENGNTVSSNIVTEAIGDALTTLEGILLEEQRTNLIPYSWDATMWAINTLTSTVASSVPGPAGTTAYELTDSDGASALNIGSGNLSSTIANNDAVTVSAYVLKDSVPGSTRFSTIGARFTGGTTTRADLGINTQTGAVVGTVRNGSGTILAAYSESAGSFWRCVLVFQNDASGNTGVDVWVTPAAGADASLSVFSSTAQGTATITGVQAEVASAPTSLITTNGASAQRNADSFNYPIGSMNETEGTIYLEWIPDLDKADYAGANIPLLDATSAALNVGPIYIDTTAGAISTYDGASNEINHSASYSAGDTVKIALRWSESAGKFNIAVNGTAATEATFSAWNDILTLFNDGVFLNKNGDAFGTIKNLKFWNTALTDAQLQALTA